MDMIEDPINHLPPAMLKRNTVFGDEDLPTEVDTNVPINRVPMPLLKRSADCSLHTSNRPMISDGTFGPMPQDKRHKWDVPRPSFISYKYRSMVGLSSLQLSHNAPIPLCALEIATTHLWKCMPREARQCLHILPPNGPALWGACEKSPKTMYAKMDQQARRCPGVQGTKPGGPVNLKTQPWIIWPLWIEDQWGLDYVTVIWYSKPSDEKDDVFDQLVAYAIVDPRRSPKADADGRHHPIKDRMERIRDRLLEFWGRAGINVQNAVAMDIRCSPMPLNETSSGERCFAVIQALIYQIIDWYIKGKEFCSKTTITSMHQWVNPYQQRIQMTGINAWILMASEDYNARIVVQPTPNAYTEVVADGKKMYLKNYDLAGPYHEQRIASWDYLLPADRQYTAPAETGE